MGFVALHDRQMGLVSSVSLIVKKDKELCIRGPHHQTLERDQCGGLLHRPLDIAQCRELWNEGGCQIDCSMR
ncbi:uncharacterized [Tachysurus ichikawai]